MQVFSRILNKALQLLDQTLVELYSASKKSLRHRLLMPVYALRRFIFFLSAGLFFDIYLMEGEAPQLNGRLRIGSLSGGHGREYLAHHFFQSDPEIVTYRGRIPFWKQAAAAKALAAEANLVVVERNSLLNWKPSTGEWVCSPIYVRMVAEMDLSKPWEEIEPQFKAQKRNIRHLKKAGFAYRISNRMEDFHFFYDCMYYPLMSKRHGEDAFVESREQMLTYFRKGELLFIDDRDGNPVAGSLNMRKGDVLFGLALGVMDAREDLMHEGALSAIYYFVLQWAYENHISRCDSCEVRPFAQDGVYTYKHRWGFRPVTELWNTREWMFWAPGPDPAAQNFVRNHPFLPEFCQTHTLAT